MAIFRGTGGTGDSTTTAVVDAVTEQSAIATTKAQEAATSASNALTSETNAATSATTASTKATEANTAKTAAENAKTAAETARDAAQTAQTAAESARDTAQTHANTANNTYVQTVAGISTEIQSLDSIKNAITGVNTIKSDVTTVSNISSDVTAVASDATDIGTVSSNIANVNSVGNNIANVNSVATNATNINTVASDGTDIGTVATNISNVNTVAGISSDVTTVAGLESKMDTVIADASDIGTVASNIGDVGTVAGNITAVQNASANATIATNKAAEASASATSASASADSILNLTAATGDAGTDVSYNASTGVLTVPRGADGVDGSDANVTAANVTGVLTGGTGISIASNGTITNDSPDQTVSLTGAGGTSVTGTYPNFTITSSSTLTDAQIKTAYENNADTNAFTDADHSKLDGIEASADVTDTVNVTAAGALMTTGGQMTGNITFSGTQTVDGRDLSVDGARLDTLERTARLRFQKRGYTNTVSFLTLTTSYQQIGQSLRLNDAINVDCEHELELNMILNYADINSSNEGFFAVTVDAPVPASETTVNLGTVITHSTSGSGYTFKVAGNVTKYMSPYCGMSVNSDGSSAFGFNNNDGWFYDPQTNQTTIECYAYQANKPSTGDTVYLHPFDWETSGTEIFGDTYPLEAYNANGTVNQNQFYKIYLGYHEGGRYYKIKARETTASENLSISLVNGTYSQIIGS